LAVDHRKLKAFVVKALLNAGVGRLFAHFVVFVGRPLYIVHGRVPGPIEAGNHHLRQAKIFCPGDSAGKILPELVNVEVRAFAFDAQVAENFSKLGSLVFGETRKSVTIPYRRTQLDPLKSSVGKLLDRTGKIAADHRSDRIRLTSNWQPERIGAKFDRGGGQKPGNRRIRRYALKKRSS